MCTHDHRRAIALEDGAGHDLDHASWTRRDFMSGLGLGVAGAALWGGSTPARAFAGSPLLSALGASETDRVLVLVQLAGGNDGLNTVVPVRNDLYYNARPRLAVPRSDTFALDGDHGMNRALSALEGAWGGGDLAVVQSVGYDDHSLSHFRSTDVWFSASDAAETLDTGWLGRSMPTLYPAFADEPPSAPPAIQIGVSAPLLFQGTDAGYAMSVFDVDQFLDLVESQPPYDAGAVPDTAAGDELAYLRTVANDAFRYRDAIGDAADAASNGAAYPDTTFGSTLGAVARLVKGRLDTRVFLVSLSGFDTHAEQSDRHAGLLTELSETLASFYDDLGLTGDDARVLTLTFSEFGRRIEENGSAGTDHGASAPLFLVGPAVQGGLYGTAPDLAAPDGAGNVRHHTDFRSVYATVLERWLGLEGDAVAAALGRPFPLLDVLPGPASVSAGPSPSSMTALHPPSPNPMRGRGQIAFDLEAAGHVRLALYDVRGRRVAVLEDGLRPAGSHVVALEAGSLPAGSYVVRLEAGGQSRTVQATVVR